MYKYNQHNWIYRATACLILLMLLAQWGCQSTAAVKRRQRHQDTHANLNHMIQKYESYRLENQTELDQMIDKRHQREHAEYDQNTETFFSYFQ